MSIGTNEKSADGKRQVKFWCSAELYDALSAQKTITGDTFQDLIPALLWTGLDQWKMRDDLIDLDSNTDAEQVWALKAGTIPIKIERFPVTKEQYVPLNTYYQFLQAVPDETWQAVHRVVISLLEFWRSSRRKK